ncbi:ribonuclease P/MRP protein subunit [Dipodascopsis uninucleata]
MVRFKSRYILFSVHYPTENVEDLLVFSAYDKVKTAHAHDNEEISPKSQGSSDQMILPGGILPNIDHKSRLLLQWQPSPDLVDMNAVNTAIRDSINRNFGDLGAGLVRSSLNLRYYSKATSMGIVRVSRDHFRLVWAALTFINEIADQKVVVTVEHVSGTMRKCQKAAMAKDRSLIGRAIDIKIPSF